MVSEHRYPDSAIPQQSKKAAQEEQQASNGNQYMRITRAEVVWSSAWNQNLHLLFAETHRFRKVFQLQTQSWRLLGVRTKIKGNNAHLFMNTREICSKIIWFYFLI